VAGPAAGSAPGDRVDLRGPAGEKRLAPAWLGGEPRRGRTPEQEGLTIAAWGHPDAVPCVILARDEEATVAGARVVRGALAVAEGVVVDNGSGDRTAAVAAAGAAEASQAMRAPPEKPVAYTPLARVASMSHDRPDLAAAAQPGTLRLILPTQPTPSGDHD
jgi:hypothetical protein